MMNIDQRLLGDLFRYFDLNNRSSQRREYIHPAMCFATNLTNCYDAADRIVHYQKFFHNFSYRGEASASQKRSNCVGYPPVFVTVIQ
jgi:hypothetical protein